MSGYDFLKNLLKTLRRCQKVKSDWDVFICSGSTNYDTKQNTIGLLDRLLEQLRQHRLWAARSVASVARELIHWCFEATREVALYPTGGLRTAGLAYRLSRAIVLAWRICHFFRVTWSNFQWLCNARGLLYNSRAEWQIIVSTVVYGKTS